MKTVITVSGIRPDFIRMSHVFKRLDADPEINHILIHSGQHYDKLLSDVFFEELDIRKPDYNLEIGQPGKTHYEQLGDLTVLLLDLIEEEKLNPDVIMFLGDSNSAGVAFPLKKEGYKIAHIEAGMRSRDKRMLEEINRTVCDHCSDIHFVYHPDYKMNLINENLPSNNIYVVGNTIVEPLKEIADKYPRHTMSQIICRDILVDIHRPENFKSKTRMQNIINYIVKSCKKYETSAKMLEFPRTMKAIEEFGIEIPTEYIRTVPLMSYVQFVHAMRDCKFMISDSGTAQEEPALLGVPVIVPRDFTERHQSIAANCSFMLEVNTENTTWDSSYMWLNTNAPMSIDWLGDGTTSQQIVDILKRVL